MEKTYQVLKILIWVLVFAVILAGAYVLYSNLSGAFAPGTLATEPTQQTTSLAPDFTLEDMEGNSRTLSEFVGKPVILNFWASWCGPCKMEMPEFQKAYEKYGEDIHFLMVNLTGGRETLETAKAFLAETDYTFPVYFDTQLQGTQYYNVASVPVTYFIDAEGYFVAWGQGALSEEMLQQGIDMLLK